jgi:predicted permease
MGMLLQDLRYAVRQFVKRPGFTAVAVLTLALGIGATVAIFSIINAVMLRPLPVHEPHRLVALSTATTGGESTYSFSYPDYLGYRGGLGALSGLAAYDMREFSLRAADLAEPVLGVATSDNYFRVLGVHPAKGRFYMAEADGAGNPDMVAVLSFNAWRERYDSDPGVIGKTLHLNGYPMTIIGIAPEGFTGTLVGISPEIWVPLAAAPQLEGIPTFLSLLRVRTVGRLAPGVSHAQAQAALAVRARQLAADPGTNLEIPARIDLHPVTGLPADDRAAIVGFLALLFAIAGLVLGIASANVAGMLLARATHRRKEVAIRLSMGAGRGRLVRQLLTESILLWTLGGTAGILVSVWITELLLTFRHSLPVPVDLDLSVDLRVLGFALVLSLATGVVFGLVPALRATRTDLVTVLKGGDRRGRHRSRLQSSFVIGQIATSLLLLITAGLLVRALQRAWTLDPGFNPDQVVIASFDFSLNGYDSPRGQELLRELRARLEATPEVESTALASAVPLGTMLHFARVELPGRPSPGGQGFRADMNSIFPGYFHALQISLLRGRSFTAADRQGATPVAIISETTAQRLWPEGGAIGARIQLEETSLEVVGVAADVQNRKLGEAPGLYVYRPYAQDPRLNATLILRTRGDEAAALARLRREVRALDPDAPLMTAAALRNWIGHDLLPQRIAAALTGAFGLVGLLLAAIGLYGIMAYWVGQRTHEVGVRMALGARSAHVLRLIMRQGLALVAGGVLIGIAASLAATRLLSSLLFGVSPTDPLTFAGIAVFFTTVALLASYLPARRATRVDPMVALRAE